MRGTARAFLLGAAAALAIEGIAAALVIVSGVIDVAAVSPAGAQDRVLAYASTRSIAHHAPADRNPVASAPAALETGRRIYASTCVACHGAPGVDPEPFAAGLHPAAPDLASPAVQAFTDGMLYEVISRGIGSTGMPAFGPGRPATDIWSIVAFVRKLPLLTPEEKKDLQERPDGRAHATAAPVEEKTLQAAPGRIVHHVSISNFRFDPPRLEVHPGDVVEWKNEDLVAHTATAVDHSFDTGRIDADQVKSVVPPSKGEFPYFCRYHLTMKGVLIVK